ncbi:hypothetical protein EV643_111168 [Kribbella sp. VKM Ac-2527]|uniref:Uncharacterized protein n=1 Tax=Kribbella caucasensis TaxID=2512215 RepID=A0A4R6KCY4_9ACTN|nr:hypothetical protein [Kribbella sp. VKM Ac-2527]TDO46315.1 hypothetical protein EV643_111168 [Kribbella sp. VKM Ac-2527]
MRGRLFLAAALTAVLITMTTGPGWWAAVTTYNQSAEYAREVLDRSNE